MPPRVKFQDPSYPLDHVFSAVLLPNAKIPERVLKPGGNFNGTPGSYRPQLGFSSRGSNFTPIGHGGPGHRMIRYIAPQFSKCGLHVFLFLGILYQIPETTGPPRITLSLTNPAVSPPPDIAIPLEVSNPHKIRQLLIPSLQVRPLLTGNLSPLHILDPLLHNFTLRRNITLPHHVGHTTQ